MKIPFSKELYPSRKQSEKIHIKVLICIHMGTHKNEISGKFGELYGRVSPHDFLLTRIVFLSN